jgi:chromate transporter
MDELLKLFISFFKVGALSFGGAYSLIPVIESETVIRHSWLTADEFLKVLGMVEIIPGAISIKFATYTGYKAAGIPGAIVANLGNLTCPVILISIVAYTYSYIEKHEYIMNAFKGIKFAVLGMILAIVYQYFIKNYADWSNIIFLVLGFGLTIFFRLNPVYIIGISGLLAMLIYKIRF